MKKFLGYTLLVFMFLGIQALLVWNSVRRGGSLHDALMASVFTIIATMIIVALAALATYLITKDE